MALEDNGCADGLYICICAVLFSFLGCRQIIWLTFSCFKRMYVSHLVVKWIDCGKPKDINVFKIK